MVFSLSSSLHYQALPSTTLYITHPPPSNLCLSPAPPCQVLLDRDPNNRAFLQLALEPLTLEGVSLVNGLLVTSERVTSTTWRDVLFPFLSHRIGRMKTGGVSGLQVRWQYGVCSES